MPQIDGELSELADREAFSGNQIRPVSYTEQKRKTCGQHDGRIKQSMHSRHRDVFVCHFTGNPAERFFLRFLHAKRFDHPHTGNVFLRLAIHP